MKKITLLLLLIANFCLAQNPTKNAGGFATITGTQTIAPSAIIEARSTTKGVLLSPMTSTQMNAIASPANGLQVTNTSDGNKPYYFDGTSWRPVVGTTETLAQTLAIDNKTNNIPIVSNNGKALVGVNDDYTLLTYDTQSLGMTDTEVQLYSEVPVAFDSNVSTDFNTPILRYNNEEVATQNWVTSQGYGTLQTLAETLAIDNKTNDIPIVSNNGKAVVGVYDDYASLSYRNQSFSMVEDGVQLYSDVPVAFNSTISTDFNTPVLNYNSEEVATQNWVTSQGYGTVTPSTLISTDADNALVLGTDSKLFVPESTGTLPYQELIFTATQSGTDAPVVTILNNPLSDTYTSSYDTEGKYILEGLLDFPTNTFPKLGTFETVDLNLRCLFDFSSISNGSYFWYLNPLNLKQIIFKTGNGDAQVDDVLDGSQLFIVKIFNP